MTQRNSKSTGDLNCLLHSYATIHEDEDECHGSGGDLLLYKKTKKSWVILMHRTFMRRNQKVEVAVPTRKKFHRMKPNVWTLFCIKKKSNEESKEKDKTVVLVYVGKRKTHPRNN